MGVRQSLGFRVSPSEGYLFGDHTGLMEGLFWDCIEFRV